MDTQPGVASQIQGEDVILVIVVMFRWTHFTRWQGELFPAYLRKTDRLSQAESLGAVCFSRSARMSVSLYLYQVSTLPHGVNMPCSDGAVADTRPLNSAAEGSAGVL